MKARGTHKVILAAVTIVLPLIAATTSVAQTIDAYWVGGPTGNWEVNGNWSPPDYWPDNLNGVHTYSVCIAPPKSRQSGDEMNERLPTSRGECVTLAATPWREAPCLSRTRAAA